MPWVPCAGMMVNSFLLETLNSTSFIFWAVWMGACIMIYLVYGLHHSQGEGVTMDQYGNKIEIEGELFTPDLAAAKSIQAEFVKGKMEQGLGGGQTPSLHDDVNYEAKRDAKREAVANATDI
ncbi:hypothetical protein CEUSTIGMA_g2935.t1 [Chlamydomonas eustigma]|uniref:Cationic amino acid transporter C-terminal domain-containing protein n=1 Tax=Chlamydomonas eustigma TaxID=1157962 RepID=A0A250WY01_9CHLO|nr:hypothetical protein CEUSTIGMA_g2935.t1 [Chlamydomonas eustigma]|eukprot:GAX75492.1 hypothetical protein CEUSTIGMA_g2935.t1 [Chlamydomonas eustigma]